MYVVISADKDITNLFTFNEHYRQFENILQYPKDSLFEIDVTGSAYLIKRNVFENVKYKAVF
jgi:hypothetical protein